MEELNLSDLVSQESFLNYCFHSNANDVAYWESWLIDHPEYKKQVEEIKTTLLLLPTPSSKKVIDHDFQILKENIAKIKEEKPAEFKKVKLWSRIAGIAAAIAVIASGVYFFSDRTNTTDTNPATHWANDVKPGGNRAVLTMPNGETISLSDTKTGVVIKASGLTYNDGTSIEHIKTKGSEITTITTPRGGQYNIELPDGTLVALNAASTLKFPATFLGLVNRTVELAGEGYFQVTRDKKHPFIVKSAGQTIEVLGTHFNINSYADEPKTKTTLLEGSIKVSGLSSTSRKRSGDYGNEKILKPGEQSQLSDDGKILITEVNTNEAIAWKNGKFVFKDESLGSIMRKISRWYNVDVIYQGIDPQEPFWGSVSRFENVSKVLEKLELTGGIHFKIEGNKIYVGR